MATDWTTNTIMLWSGTKVSDHNRAPLSVSYERLGSQQRMINGTMRQYYIADKRTFTTSWENLPSTNATGMKTADLGMAATDLEAFYKATPGVFTLTLRNGAGVTETFSVFISEFSKEINKRGPRNDLWNVNVTLVEA